MKFSEIGSVLVIDDDPIIAAVAESYFLSRGVVDFLHAENGTAALQILKVQEEKIDLVLCDLSMPEMDGAQFFRYFADYGFDKPIIVLSGEERTVVALAGSLVRAHKLNLVGTLQKPLDCGALDELIGKAESSQRVTNVERKQPSFNADDLQTAIRLGQINVFYQPKVDTKSGAVAGAEALARWDHPECGQIMPDFFVPLAEKSGLMEELTHSIIHQATRDAQTLLEMNANWHTSLNIDPCLLLDIEFPEKVRGHICEAGLDPTRFTLEITEVNPIEKNAIAMEVLVRLRMMQFGLSIDDFGKDYSNISYLKDFPFTEIKIDRSFVKGLPKDDRARATVRAILGLSRDMELSVVAEGVETPEQCKFIAGEGIDQIQGYLVARPMSFQDLQKWYSGYRYLGADLLNILSESDNRAPVRAVN